MGTIKTREDLREAINLLEANCLIQRQEILSTMNHTIENLNPLRLIKNTVQKVKSASLGKEKTINTLVGLGANLILKKLIPTGPGSYIKTIAVSILKSILLNRQEKELNEMSNHNYRTLNGTADIED